MMGPGTRLKNRYRLERLLGRGGMASVWLAVDEVLERPVAIKVLSDTIASDPEFLARFRREARVAAGLSHPNLIGVYDYAEGGERPYLVMEYVPGGNLTERIAQGAEIDCERVARELLGALAHIHAAGILHRDVKPQNVLLSADGSAKLIDFGIALPRDATTLTRTGNLLGTARYIAPEVMRGEPATEQSDLFSCGVVLSNCLAERPQRRLRPLVRRLCEPAPANRPASAKAALSELGRGASVPEEPTETLRTTLPRTRAQPPGREERARSQGEWRRTAAVVAGVAVFAGGFLIFAGGSDEGRDGRPDSTQSAGGGGQGDSPQGRRAPVPSPSGEDPALGAALNEDGYALIQAGRPEEAVPVLERAVRAFPPGTEDLNYAYALFNLGNALRLSGRPEEAIPVLERRLEIPNQTGVVRRELAAARRSAS